MKKSFFSKTRTWVIGLILLAILAFVAVSFFRGGEEIEVLEVSEGHFIQQISVSGKVEATDDVDLGFTQGGRVSHVYIRVGDQARAGALLAEIENGELRASVLQKEAVVLVRQAKLKSLLAGTRPEQIAITKSKVESDRQAYTQSKEVLVDELRNAYTVSDDAVRNQVDQFISNPRVSPKLNFVANDQGLQNRIQETRLVVERSFEAWLQNLTAIKDSIDLRPYVSEAEKNLELTASLLRDASIVLQDPSRPASFSEYVADVSIARTKVNAAITSLTSAITAQKNADTALETSKRNLALEEAGATEADVEAERAEVKAAEADLLNAQAQLLKTRVIAPFTGIVTAVDAKVGQTIATGARAVSMMGSGAFQIEVFVPEINISVLEIGDKATVTLDAYGENTPFGARVISIDPAETIRDGVSMYRSILEFIKQDSRIKAGMTANILITTEEKVNVISVPQGVVKEKKGKKYIDVIEEGTITEREVETGSVSSMGTVEIVAGLSIGDKIVIQNKK